MSKVLQERGFGSLSSSTETNPRDHVKSISTIIKGDSYSIRRIGFSLYAISTRQNRASISVMPLSTYLNLGLGELAHTKLTVELADRTMKYPKGIAKNVLVGIGKFVFPIDFIILDMPEDIKVPLILRIPFLSTAHAKIDFFKRKITLRVREERIIFKSVKPTSNLIKRVYMLGLRERMELDLEASLMGETLVLNRSLEPFLEDYIELNDLNVPLEIRRDQVDDLMPTIEEGEVIKEFIARNDARMVSKVFGYPSDCDHDKKIRIDCAYNLKFSCMIVLEDMDAYRDEGMGDISFGELFLKEVTINVKRFEGVITIHNGNEEVTYQMVRPHPRFKHHTNEQCNKIPPLLKTSLKEKKSTMLVENLRSGNLEVLES
ncbi:putative reverse transcriptase domain-containing protein [Tanacetum coccineum]